MSGMQGSDVLALCLCVTDSSSLVRSLMFTFWLEQLALDAVVHSPSAAH